MNRKAVYLAMTLALLAAAAAGVWAVSYLLAPPGVPVEPRLPVKDLPMFPSANSTALPLNPGTLTPGPGKPSDDPGDWPWFRGPDRTNIAPPEEKILRAWPADGPQILWRLQLGEGHAGAAVRKGRVFIIDYDRDRQEDAIRCLSLSDATEIWRYTYSVDIKRNHGMSRTVPAVTDEFVVTIGPMGHVTCLRMATGDLVWKLNLVKDFRTQIPPWYAGQCPYIDGGRVILAPGGTALVMAVELATGKVLWQTPNPDGWGMTHSSIASITHNGVKTYIYCATNGVVGVDAEDGRLLWKTPDWTVKLANIPTPVVVDGSRFLLTGGYGAGAMMCRLDGDPPRVTTAYRLKPEVFSSEQHTPILDRDYFYGIIQGGQMACMDVEGRQVWASGSTNRFGLGPYLMADGVILALNDQEGTLHMIGASTSGYTELARARLLHGHDAGAPMALANGKLLLRDLTEMLCVKVGTREP